MLNSTFSLIGNQFNLTSSRQARDEITCRHSSGEMFPEVEGCKVLEGPQNG